MQAATAGGVDAIVQAMRTHEKRAPVQEWAVWALRETAVKSAANRALIGRSSGAVEATLAAMRTHSAAVGVQDHSCRLVAVLCQGDAENAARAVQAGAVDAIVTAVILHPLAQSVQQHGFAALAAMASASDAGLEKVRGARCVTTVLEGIERFPQHKGVQARACVCVPRPCTCSALPAGIDSFFPLEAVNRNSRRPRGVFLSTADTRAGARGSSRAGLRVAR